MAAKHTLGSAHLQKWRSLLQTLNRQKDDAHVFLESRDVGTLAQAELRWWISGSLVRLRLKIADRPRTFLVSSVRRSGSGLEILIRQVPGTLPRRLTIAQGAEPSTPDCTFWESVRAWLSVRYPGHEILTVARRPDRAHSISGDFLYIRFRYRGKSIVVLCCDPGTDAPDAHAVLTQVFLHLELLRAEAKVTPPEVLVIVPPEISPVVYHCGREVPPRRARLSMWETTGESGNFRRVRCPEPPVENRDFRWPVLGPFKWSLPLGRVLDLAPRFIRRYPRFEDYDSLRLWGLEFARATGESRDRILFGVGPPQVELSDDNFERLRALVDEILYFRRPDSPATDHPYYRMQAERWLESLILEDAPRLFPELAPEAIYSQIPVYLGKDPGRVDILGVDREGVLVVMELKVSANPNLPLQALDYWSRVLQHNKQGDFERRGYFAEVSLGRRQPRIYLVAPVFSFHDSTETILSYLDPCVEVWKIALNEDWRSGVRVLGRTLLKCTEET